METDTPNDARKLMKWFLQTKVSKARRFIAKQGFLSSDDLIQDAFVALLERPPPKSIKTSTACCKAVHWSVGHAVAKMRRVNRLHSLHCKPIDSLPDDAREFHAESRCVDKDLDMPVIAVSILKVLKTLTERERTVIELRFGLNGSEQCCINDCAKKMGVSRTRVMLLESSAMKKIEHTSRRDILAPFV